MSTNTIPHSHAHNALSGSWNNRGNERSLNVEQQRSALVTWHSILCYTVWRNRKQLYAESQRKGFGSQVLEASRVWWHSRWPWKPDMLKWHRLFSCAGSLLLLKKSEKKCPESNAYMCDRLLMPSLLRQCLFTPVHALPARPCFCGSLFH